MAQLELKAIIDSLPAMELGDLRSLQSHLDLVVRIRSEGEVSTDLAGGVSRDEESGLAEAARELLTAGVEEGKWTLADRALLAAVILSDSYHQEKFSSRDLNDVIEECGQPRVVHITSALTRLLDRGYLEGTSKELSLPAEGRSKARGLLAMLSRTRDAA